MASVHLNENGDSFDALPEQPECNEEPDVCDELFPVREIFPRIGSEFQAEIPPLKVESTDAETSQDNFLIGLPIPLTWISLKNETPSQDFVGLREKFGGSHIDRSNDSRNLEKYVNDESSFLVPGLSSEHWTDAEKASFILGLYIFEKNFVEVKRFVETKGMGAILSFYYGEFYGSDQYRRWSDCQKTKNKKCVHGQRIFSGWRQQELLSRMLPRVSEECRTVLLQVSKAFGEEKMSLTEYVSSLKAVVGLNILVEAVGIGTGKQDLTGTALEPSRSNQPVHLRPEIPSGKACSSLTTTEIIKFLSGDYRLSKARSNDLFWEAVWPRLLARGWHSEQPNDQGYLAGFKNSLVFLVPGVKKFSRLKLVKGEQYFDSITDVLSKVAKEPGLIELEEIGEVKKEEVGVTAVEKKSEKEDDDDLSPMKQRHYYLQPRTPNRGADFLKFTVIDTSLSKGQVRELRSLPSDISSTMISRVVCMKNDASFETTDESETINAILRNASITDTISVKTAKSGGKLLLDGPGPNPNPHATSKVYPNSRRGKPKNLNEKKQSKKLSKSLFDKRDGRDYVPPVAKKCRTLAACNHEEKSDDIMSNSWIAPKLENPMSSCCSGIQGLGGNLSSGAGSCQDKLSSTSSSRGSPCESVDCVTYRNTNASDISNHRTQPLIDLNIPQVPPDFDNVIELPKEDETDVRNNSLPGFSGIEVKSEQQPVDHILPKSTESKPEQPSDVNPRRQSTRNRPPTTRALEALANGYLTVSKKRKNKEGNKHEEMASRASTRPRSGPGPTEPTNSFMSSRIEETENFVPKSGKNDKFLPPEAHEQSVSDF